MKTWTEEERQKRRGRKRQYRAEHREELNARQRQFYQRHWLTIRLQAADYQRRTSPERKEAWNRWRRTNLERARRREFVNRLKRLFGGDVPRDVLVMALEAWEVNQQLRHG